LTVFASMENAAEQWPDNRQRVRERQGGRPHSVYRPTHAFYQPRTKPLAPRPGPSENSRTNGKAKGDINWPNCHATTAC